jgi:hypothetical protein
VVLHNAKPATCRDTPIPPSLHVITVHLDLDSTLESLPPLLHASVRLSTHDTTTPVANGVLVLLQVTVIDGRDELGELALVLGADLGQSKNSGSLRKLVAVLAKIVCETYLLVNDGAESGLALHYRVGDAHLAAKRGKEDNQLNGVNVVGD